jgi:hypothetical protein
MMVLKRNGTTQQYFHMFLRAYKYPDQYHIRLHLLEDFFIQRLFEYKTLMFFYLYIHHLNRAQCIRAYTLMVHKRLHHN